MKGASEKPVYLWIDDGKAEIRGAGHLWGKTDAFETEDALKEELGDPKIRVAPIGPAGENLVRYAGLICNYGHGCAAEGGKRPAPHEKFHPGQVAGGGKRFEFLKNWGLIRRTMSDTLR